MKSTGGQINFNFIFAVIIGAVIIFIAVFASVKYSSTSSYSYNTKIAEQLNILLDPLETSQATSLATSVVFKEDARISIDCYESEFGRNNIKVDLKSMGKWNSFGVPASSSNKYIFASKISEGKQLTIFPYSFEMPFYVSDLILLGMKQYCFIDPPENILEELTDLNVSNIRIVANKNFCKKNETSVCFGSQGCNINVVGQGTDYWNEYELGYIDKSGIKLNYIGNGLMYAAIFSDSSNYKCNFNRLMYRISKLTDLYYQKSAILEAKGCNMGSIKDELGQLKQSAVSNANVLQLKTDSDQLQNKNDMLICRLW